MLSNTLKLNFCYLKIIHILHSYHPKIIWHILKNKQKNKCVCIHEIIRLIIMKMKNRSHRCDINRRRSRHGHKYNKCKKCLRMMMLICTKQHLSNIWSPIHEKAKQNWGSLKKKVCILTLKCSNGLFWLLFGMKVNECLTPSFQVIPVF